MSYSEQLCGCVNDVFSCLICADVPCGTCIVQALATNQATNIGFLRPFVFSLFCCFGMSHNRQQIKRKYNIPETYWEDCLIFLCCAGCAAAQDYRETENRYLANP
jgi:Cys-rich protein (TIGR01571 family)